jgi:hypothetical protein
MINRFVLLAGVMSVALFLLTAMATTLGHDHGSTRMLSLAQGVALIQDVPTRLL